MLCTGKNRGKRSPLCVCVCVRVCVCVCVCVSHRSPSLAVSMCWQGSSFASSSFPRTKTQPSQQTQTTHPAHTQTRVQDRMLRKAQRQCQKQVQRRVRNTRRHSSRHEAGGGGCLGWLCRPPRRRQGRLEWRAQAAGPGRVWRAVLALALCLRLLAMVRGIAHVIASETHIRASSICFCLDAQRYIW